METVVADESFLSNAGRLPGLCCLLGPSPFLPSSLFYMALWSRTIKNLDVNTGPLARPFARLLALLTHLLTHSALLALLESSTALICSLACSVSDTRAVGKEVFIHDIGCPKIVS